MTALDVLIPTCQRPAALAVTLAGLIAQDFRDFHVIVSDQTEHDDPFQHGSVQTAIHVLRLQGHSVELHRHLPRRGLAEHRQFLLEESSAAHVLFLDDDLILESDVVGRMHRTLLREACGFVGCAPIGPSHAADIRPHQQHIEWWDGPVQPETVRPDAPRWQRHHLHSAANLYHLQRRLDLTPATQRTYRVAWIGACVLYDAAKLRACGGFGFWRELPAEHCGEDVLAQLRVMDRFGGCGLIPSGVYHQELPTTVVDRRVNAPHALPVELPA
jgi:GT2 family glycosyltransferase